MSDLCDIQKIKTRGDICTRNFMRNHLPTFWNWASKKHFQNCKWLYVFPMSTFCFYWVNHYDSLVCKSRLTQPNGGRYSVIISENRLWTIEQWAQCVVLLIWESVSHLALSNVLYYEVIIWVSPIYILLWHSNDCSLPFIYSIYGLI